MDAAAIAATFQRGTYNYAADAKMLLFFTEMTGVTAVTLAILALLSVVVKNFWCRYAVPVRRAARLVSWASPQRSCGTDRRASTARRAPGRARSRSASTRAVRLDAGVHRLHVVRGGVPRWRIASR